MVPTAAPELRSGARFLRVAVPHAPQDAYTYRLPPALGAAEAGCRVLVPFGAERLTGVVIGTLDEPDVEEDRLRDVQEVLDERPVLSPALLALGAFIADYYLAPLGEVLRGMHGGGPRQRLVARITAAGELARAGLARGTRQQALLDALASAEQLPLATLGRRVRGAAGVLRDLAARGWIELAESLAGGPRDKTVAAWEATGAALPPAALAEALGRSVARRDVLAALAAAQVPVTPAELAADLGHGVATVRQALARLVEAGLARAAARRVSRRPPGASAAEAPAGARSRLSDDQAAALAEACDLVAAGRFAVLLVEGVTGSGKTEVYLRALAAAVVAGRTGLYLVPEIAITPLLMREVRRRFGERTAILHSGLSPGERHDERRRILAGGVDVVLGARSAVFAPLPRLGLLVVDEEHESSYKQDGAPRYHGRDVAVMRGRLEGVPVVLGSATPSLETYHHAVEGRYLLRRLPRRVGGARRARVEIVDMRLEAAATGAPTFSRPLREALDQTLAAGQQAMILLNRRGWADFLLCRECGEPERCDHCSVTLTVHLREGRLVCHYCGDSRPIPERCPRCRGTFLQNVGKGTEQVEREIEQLFPGLPVARLDRDVARRRGVSARILADFEAGRTRILLGTQMIAKGHDFPGVTLVGVLQADRQLFLPDFRAAERTFQLLVQVAGRAGRRTEPGRVVIQTYSADHPAMTQVERQDFPAFYAAESALRRATGYPPCSRLVALTASAEDEAAVLRHGAALGAALEGASPQGCRVLGPAPAPVARIKGRHRVQLLLRGTDRRGMNAAVRRALVAAPAPEGVDVEVDVDPQSLL